MSAHRRDEMAREDMKMNDRDDTTQSTARTASSACRRVGRPRGLGRSAGFPALAALACLSVSAMPADAAESVDAGGYIYGVVTAESGNSYEGRLRWGQEEAAWGDLFNATKEDRPWVDIMPADSKKRRRPIRIWGWTIGMRWSEDSSSRAFQARFGDIAKILPKDGDTATVIMKSGTEFKMDGGSNDIGAKITVWDSGVGEIAIEWDRIESIEFREAPRGLSVDVGRIHGTLVTTAGSFTGFVQWDQDECLTKDKLDGDGEDGDLSIEFGNIRLIERRSSGSSRVVLRDGREFTLRGSNDVNSENRGNFVDDPRYGRIMVNWDTFERLELTDSKGSGPAYGEFTDVRPLHGRVTRPDGGSLSGKLVYDLDEEESWELLDGKWKGLTYRIPFSLIKSLERTGDDSSRVVLHSNVTVDLEDTADVGDGNAGLAVIASGREAVWVDWADVKRIDFDHRPK